ncbi:MAG: aminotransferase class I/II-fold pyridoxal phosphate-dependent enzyme [Actinophytocola sp.]|uniref:MalY/PatB family protein n=1 Tax=Actinophytocola sp. TaxID=1872138 RepID=UPI003C77AB1A
MFDQLDPDDLRQRPGAKWALADPGVLPAWVADMDFTAPKAVRAAVARHADFGYPLWDERPEQNPLRGAFVARMAARHGVALDAGHVRLFTELNQALQVVLHVATEPGDAVAVHTPTYPPFLESVHGMGRRLVPIPLTDSGAGWTFDADRLAADVVRHGVRALVLVNPHNPTGRVFTRAELTAIAAVAEEHDLVVIADEVHSDLTYDGFTHIPFASLCPHRTVTLYSASKSYNLAGLRCAVAHVGDARVRSGLAKLPPLLLGEVSVLSVLATLAAWQECDDWLFEAKATLARNRALVAGGLPEGVRHHSPEATYLAWLDCRELRLDVDPAAFFLERADVLLSPGPDYGSTGYVRLNFATSGPLVEELLNRMATAVATR